MAFKIIKTGDAGNGPFWRASPNCQKAIFALTVMVQWMELNSYIGLLRDTVESHLLSKYFERNQDRLLPSVSLGD
ncbi:MAG: hypothetical protein R2788_09955 [Saprospiraceae bacterium]